MCAQVGCGSVYPSWLWFCVPKLAVVLHAQFGCGSVCPSVVGAKYSSVASQRQVGGKGGRGEGVTGDQQDSSPYPALVYVSKRGKCGSFHTDVI